MAHRPFHLMVYRGKIALEEQSADFMLLWNLNEPVQVCSDNETFEMKKDDLLSLNPYECFLLGIHTVRKVCGGYQPATAGF